MDSYILEFNESQLLWALNKAFHISNEGSNGLIISEGVNQGLKHNLSSDAVCSANILFNVLPVLFCFFSKTHFSVLYCMYVLFILVNSSQRCFSLYLVRRNYRQQPVVQAL